MSKIISDGSLVSKVSKLQEELEELNRLFELTRILNFASDINSLAENLVELLYEQMHSNNAAFFILSEKKYRLAAYKNIEISSLLEIEDTGSGIWKIVNDGKPFPITDEKGKNIYASFFKDHNLDCLKSSLWVPFIFENKVIAILSLGTKDNKKGYSQDDLKYLDKISGHVVQAINKFKSQEEKEVTVSELQKTLHNISILYNIGQAMNFIDDLKRLLRIILDKAIQTVGAEKGSLMLYDQTTNELVIKVVYGLPDKDIEDKINEGLIPCTRIKVGEGIAGEVFVTKKAIIANLGSNDPRFMQAGFSNVSSILCIPLIVKEEVIGVINITNKLNGKFFNHDDLNFIGALANQAAIAINNAQLYELATTDGLTKLYIYRHFLYLLENEIKRSTRYNHQVSLLMMDIDNFKSINDTYGHQLGDEILKQIAQVITKTCRKIDMPARYGGEEFALILPETPKENARSISERLRQSIEQVVVYTKGGVPVSPTISIGIASYPEHASNMEELIEASDKAMYFAKKHGKNCVAEYLKESPFIINNSAS